MTRQADHPDVAPGPITSFVRTYWLGVKLWKRILGALLIGVVIGSLWGEGAEHIRWIGDLFIRLIRMLVAPLVFVIIVSGIAALGDPRRLGSIGVKTLLLYVLTTAIGVTLGLTLGTLFEPGQHVSLGNATAATLQQAKPFGEQLMAIVPANPVKSLAEGEMLSIIFFALLFGTGIIAAGPKAAPVTAFFEGATAVMLRLVQFVMELAPFGVCALIASAIGANGLGAFTSIFWLGLCVLIGSAIQTLIVHGSLLRFGAWLPVLPFFRGSTDAILVGFSTSSSSATLPVAMSVAEKNLGIKPPIVSTVLPLGATMSMDGTAMYMAILSMFAVQAFGVVLTPADYVLLGITTVTVAMGTAPIPSSSLFLLTAVLTGVGISPEQAALLVGFILPFDRPLDMIRTIPNVTSDLSVATVVARWENEIDVDLYKAAPVE